MHIQERKISRLYLILDKYELQIFVHMFRKDLEKKCSIYLESWKTFKIFRIKKKL